MKKLIIILFFVALTLSSYSQLDLIGSFNTVDVGRNVMLSLKRNIKHHSFLFGLKYNINRIIHDNQNNVFRKRFYATDFGEHFGFDIGYQYDFLLKKSNVEPFLFYDFQFTNSHTRNLMFFPYGYMPNGQFVYIRILEFFGPTIAMEHNIGIGMKVKLNNRLYLYQKIGGGIANFVNVDQRHVGEANWEFASIISVGIGYQLIN